MKLYVKRIIFIALLFLGALCVGIFKTPLHFQTDLTSFINTQNKDGWPITEITNKFSLVINVVVKTSDQLSGEIVSQQIQDIVNSDDFKGLDIMTNNVSPHDFITMVKQHNNRILSDKYRQILIDGNYQEITNIAKNRVETSIAPSMLPLSVDSFMLITDYVSGMNNGNTNWVPQNGVLWQYRAPDNFYMLPISVKVIDNAEQANVIEKFKTRINEFQTNDVKIYVGGAPVHTAKMYNHSKIEITLLSTIAIVMMILLNYLLFKRMKTIIPIGISLSVGYLAGTIALFLFFSVPHILVFVFGTTLIGLGVDYSFHTINCVKDDKNLSRNMLHSLITTLICFAPLLFASISLLKQISVFTIFGLIAIYAFIKLFVSTRVKTNCRKFVNPVNKKYRPFIIVGILILAVFTCVFAKIENNMSAIYRPTKDLAESEKIIGELNQSGTSAYLIVRGENIQSVLETEESLRNDGVKFFSVSSVIPSLNRQSENEDLVKKLYKSQSKNIQKTLGLKTKPKFISSEALTLDNAGIITDSLNNFLFNDGDFVYSISSVNNDLDIKNDNVRIISPSKIMEQTMSQYSYEAYNLLIVCGIALLVALVVLYRWRAFIYLLPSLLGVGIAIGFLTVLNMPITFFHLLSLFIVVGLGLDYAIFHINTKSSSDLRPTFYSFLTSFIGFGLLSFTSFFLIAAMGMTLAIGIAVAYFTSLYLFRNFSNTKPMR